MDNRYASQIKKLVSIDWIFFISISLIFIFLCIKGGFFGYIGAKSIVFNNFTFYSGKFIILYSLTWLFYCGLIIFFPKGLSTKNIITIIFVLAVICRIALICHEPSDDINRYLWEGKLIANGISPYAHAPNDILLKGLAKADPFFAGINHPANPAAYPPMVILLFSLIGMVSYSSLSIKIVMILFDLGTLIFIFKLLQNRSLSPQWSILYAFNPIILYSFAGQAHFDSIQSFFLMGAIFFYDKKKWQLLFLFFGLAIQSKYVAIIALPFLIRKENFKYLWITIVTVIAFYIPILLIDAKSLFYCLVKFGSQYAFNGSINALFRVYFGQIYMATLTTNIIFLIILLFGYRFLHPVLNKKLKNDPITGIFFSMGLLLVFSPTIHFWYISWVIPFLAFRHNLSWIVLSLTMSLYFIANGTLHFTGKWNLPIYAMIIEWTPFLILLFREIYLSILFLLNKEVFKDIKTISVIIPTYNEEKNIKNCISALKTEGNVDEIIIVDGGSTDNTLNELQLINDIKKIVHSKPINAGGGRGGQIFKGLEKATGDLIAIVHADTIVKPNIFYNVKNSLNKEPVLVGGAIGTSFNKNKVRLYLVEVANSFRMIFLGISFGDQIQFFRRKTVVNNKIYPNIPLMEDVELSLRLKKLGKQTYFFGNSVVSSRRWKKHGYSFSLKVVKNMVKYLILRLINKSDSLKLIGVKLFRDYYK